ncbi:hypothetical protein, partial [Paenibacillus sp. NPDC093718]|uniref:hypothetical protein n=1 Tax=Paenibacillus sp. NPDC093718 TaxID=3390601 RepID=UPI003D05AE8B
MKKKIVIVSLLAATMVIPSTSTFASDSSTEVINPNTQFTQESQITSGSGDVITPMSIDYRVNAASNFRATPSPTGAYIGS